MFFNNVRMVRDEPGIIVGPISSFLGFILDFIYNLTEFIAGPAALGWSIIIFTILVNLAILPLGIKMQANMKKMQDLKPQIDAINEKYKDKKDKESQQQKAMEIQNVYGSNNVNPLAGCLPMFLQMPIFITLFNMFQLPYLFISNLHDVYSQIATQIMSIPNFHTYIQNTTSIGLDKMPANMERLLLGEMSDLLRLFNVYTPQDWQTLLYVLPSQYLNYDYIQSLLYQKDAMEHFLGISLVQNAGFLWPGILLPIFAGATTFFSSRIMMKNQPTPSSGGEGMASAMATQQKVMSYGMPIMMSFFTITAPGAVGLYWITNNLCQIAKQKGLNKIIDKKNKKNSSIIDV